ncbi:MAG: TIGR02588 family protein [Synechococcales bacterium]|nr:TIGR02588 family protein [Synechococcales bacterium]
MGKPESLSESGSSQNQIETSGAGDRQTQALAAGRSLAEWITFAIAALILLGLVGLVIFDWQVNQNRPPAFQVEVSAPRLTDGLYYVPFAIHNTGGRIARTVQVTATLQLDDEEAETGEQQIDFLSGHEQKGGSFVFTHDPQQGDLTVRVASYKRP